VNPTTQKSIKNIKYTNALKCVYKDIIKKKKKKKKKGSANQWAGHMYTQSKCFSLSLDL